MSERSPRVEGAEPVFRHLDDPDVPWQAVKAQRNRDGTDAFVREKWLAFSADPGTSRSTPTTTPA